MKKLILLIIVFGFAVQGWGQNKITGTKDDFPRGVPYYDKVNFEVTYQVVEKNGTIRVNVSNPKIFVHLDSNYNVDGISYSRQDLDLASWPQTQKPVRFGVELSVQYPGGTVNHMFSCTESGVCQDNNDYILRGVDNTNNYKSSDFRVSYNGRMFYDPQNDGDVDRRIVAKKNNTNSNTTSGSVANNSVSQPPTPSYSKQEITNQVVTGVAGLAGEMINEWNVNYDKKRARELAAFEEKQSFEAAERIIQYNEKFKNEYLPLIDRATLGDRDARMTLYFASKSLFSQKLVPQRKIWFEEALENNYPDAILEVARKAMGENEGDYDFEKGIPYLLKASSLGNVDAMVMLASYYNKIPQRTSFEGRTIIEKGGESPKLALEFFKPKSRS